ncbi:MAG: PEP-CTERM sorting domain-containing protein [Nostoc sp. DedQUE12b]|uniref:PEP-CTERM sorting domain-containing protein n=1 Tax=Nostoc sp. DedQUE12b TaxID=3075398 RepID=UPI002AD3F85E|nr:PEP-CTERM sorting domain-containing protein [Nostoc sp. DedQUE12b]MDZ8089333.1 PEP-CTERM sorting domain-containing protein [Nostoc sp. DedQUE12b]
MINFKSKLVNATLAATFAIPLATAGMFTSAGSAQAVTLNGSIGLNGTSIVPNDGINPATTSIKFVDVDGVDAYDDFAAFLPTLSGAGITINTLNLTKIANLSSTTATYSTGVYTPFINFGSRTLGSTTALLTFDLDDSVVTRIRKSATNINDVVLDGITGKFNFNGKTIANGNLGASLSGAASTYHLTLDAVSVPEPTTMLGLGLVGAGMVMSRRRKSVIQ